MVEIRIIAAVVHKKTNEVEIVIEKVKHESKKALVSFWIDCESEVIIRKL